MANISLFRSLRSRLTMAFVGLAIGPILVVGFVLTFKSISSLKNEAISYQQIEADRIGIAVGSYVRELERVLELTAKAHGFMSLPITDQQRILEELLAYENRFGSLTLIDIDGRELIRSNRIQVVSQLPLVDHSNDYVFQQAVHLKSNCFSPVLFDRVTGEPQMTIAIPLQSFQTGDIAFVLFGSIRLKKIWDLLASISHADQSVFIVDEKGNVIGHPDPSVTLSGKTFQLPSVTSGIARGLNGDDVVLATKRLAFGNQFIYIVAQTEISKALRFSQEIVLISLVIVVLALILSTFLSSVVIGSIVHPLEHLAAVTRSIQRGDLGQQVQYARNDEVGELGLAFNDMTKRLRSTIEDLETEVIERKNEIAERKKAEEEKGKLERQLQQSQKMESIGNLAGGIAHDFNNILAAILGFTELALDDVQKGSAMEEKLQEIYAGGTRAKEIVNQILAFARQSSEEVKPTRVDSIVIEALKLIRPSTPSTIEIRQDIDSHALVMGNATQIHQIMINLCTNAAHAMEQSGGVMEVSLKDVFFNEGDQEGFSAGHYIQLLVRDTGYGIAEEHLDSIFDPYFTTKKIGQGTGMGLAMTRGIIDNYGGFIDVESLPSEKTTFSIYLPVISGFAEEIIDQVQECYCGQESILLVDDEPSLVRVGKRMLEKLGYTVTSTTSSHDALQLFRGAPERFALVVTDMTMPHMTGDQLAIQLREIKPDIRVILCTGYSSKIDAEAVDEIGIDAFIYKPFSQADLANTVRTVLVNGR